MATDSTIEIDPKDLTALLLRKYEIEAGVWYLTFYSESEPQPAPGTSPARSPEPLTPTRAFLVRHLDGSPPPPIAIDASTSSAAFEFSHRLKRDYDHG